MSDCLGQLSFTTERENLERNLPKCFKPDYEDVYLIIDCTELYIEKPSQVIQQSATWSEYNGHNTGKGLIALSPLMLPDFAFTLREGSGVKNFAREYSSSYSHLLSKLWKVCCWLTAFLPPLIKDDGELMDEMKEK